MTIGVDLRCLIALSIALTRCVAPPPPLETGPVLDSAGDAARVDASAPHQAPPPLAVAVATIDIGTSVAGRTIEARLLGEPTLPAVLFLSTIHGDEWAGTPLLIELEHHLRTRPDLLREYRAVLVPVLNPDGFAANRRTNDHGVDLNRNFPAASFVASPVHGPAPLSEPESAALHAFILDLAPARVISMHQPFGVLDFDGPAEALTYAMAAVTELPVDRVGARPGSLGSWVGETLGVPIVTVEFRRHDHHLRVADLWEAYGAMLLVCLRGVESAP